jgi:hypothetical protein
VGDGVVAKVNQELNAEGSQVIRSYERRQLNGTVLYDPPGMSKMWYVL